MAIDIARWGVLVAALATLAGGCAPTNGASEPATWSRCPPDYHTEAYPTNPNPRKAYGCVSNSAGYLRYPGDEHEKMTPQ
jgi:hypothetical protein